MSGKALHKPENNHYFSLIGLIISLFAFSLAATTPWILPEISPPQQSIEDQVIEKAVSFKDKLVSRLSGEEKAEIEITVSTETDTHWTDHWILIIVSLGLAGMITGVIGYIKKEEHRTSLMAILFGLGAIIAAYAWIVFAVVIFLMLLGMVFEHFDFISL